MRKTTAICAAFGLILAGTIARAEPPKNIILFIGDGMGFEQVKAAGMYGYGAAGTLNFEKFSYQSMVSTYNASGTLTDSAAAGTAIATGYKAAIGVISMAIPGDNSNRLTLLEYFKNQGKSTGLVTTDVMTGATPATFGAHETSRNNTANIADDYINTATGSRPNVLLGGGTISGASAAGYTVITNRDTLNSASVGATGLLSGQFGSGQFGYTYDNAAFYTSNPYLWEMTSSAISQLSGNGNGFFLTVEQALIDKAGTNTNRNIFEVLELEKAVHQAINFAATRTDTLVIVTADHETGGLKVTQNNGVGNFPTVTWSSVSSGSHSTAPVPVYAFGPNAQAFTRVLDNTDFFQIATATPQATTTKRFQEGSGGYSGAHDAMIRQDAATTAFGSTTALVVDQADTALPAQAMLRFDGLFGSGAGQVPLGATITSAKLLVMTGTSTNDGTATTVAVNRMLRSWDETVTWDSLVGGISADGTEAVALADDTVAPSYNNTGVYGIFDVTGSVQLWANGAPNYGWALLPNGTDGWRFNSTDLATASASRPMLEITYVVPEPTTGAILLAGMLLMQSRRRRSV